MRVSCSASAYVARAPLGRVRVRSPGAVTTSCPSLDYSLSPGRHGLPLRPGGSWGFEEFGRRSQAHDHRRQGRGAARPLVLVYVALIPNRVGALASSRAMASPAREASVV